MRARDGGANKAVIGLAASMLTPAWYALLNGTRSPFRGGAHFVGADATNTANRLTP